MGFYEGKKVFVTGHTGFKGSYLCLMLAQMGAKVRGYALEEPCGVFEAANIGDIVDSRIGDIRDFESLRRAFRDFNADIVIHMAAQPLVRESYLRPRYTYETNVMGTVNVLECVRESDSVRSVVNVTTDKVYKNFEREEPYREDEMLDGHDPYSNSKSCSDIISHSYRASFFKENAVALSCARAGNVIGGGDTAKDRLIPDCVRAVLAKKPIVVRNPESVRPFQFVAEPLMMYLLLAERQYTDIGFAGEYNIGPMEDECVSVMELVNMFCEAWGAGAQCVVRREKSVHEANLLRLDSSKIREKLCYAPLTSIGGAVQNVCEWTRAYAVGGDVRAVMEKQTERYRI
ncbi:MAG: CDP-glucose 4,6-dehydratase [Clostridia bacterium]|nr:CDP-glucose 4,6-dehydratase [Clostridia bacterium]